MLESYAILAYSEQKIRKYGRSFCSWLQKEEGRKYIKRHREHEQFVKEELSERTLQKLNQQEFIKVLANLWVFRAWKNKTWIIEKIITKNGFAKLKIEFLKLLYGADDFQKRFDRFQKNVSGINISTMSEILSMIYPENFCLWNAKTKKVLKFLNCSLDERLFQRSIISGEEYLQCIHFMNMIKNELRDYCVKDFIDLDLFIWKIHEYDFLNYLKRKRKFDHSQIQERFEENSIWVVRPSRKKRLDKEQNIIEYKMISIGWNELCDLAFLKYKNYLINHSEVSSWGISNKISPNISVLCKFLREIKINDVVIVPMFSKGNKTVDIGKVLRDYGFQEINETRYLMKVLWLSKDIPIDNLSANLK